MPPIDPNIPLQAQVPQGHGFNVLGTLGDVLQIQRMQALTQREQRLAEEAQREQQKEQQIQNLAQQHGDDPDAFISAVSRIDPLKAQTFAQKLQQARYEKAHALGEEAKTSQAYLEAGIQLLQGATPETYGVRRNMVLKLDPRLSQLLPEQYDEQAVSGLLQVGQSTKDYLAAQRAGLEMFQKGEGQAALATMFAYASNPQQWQQVQALAQQGGLGKLLPLFGAEYSPDAQDRARRMVLGPKGEAEIAGRQADDARQDAAAAETRRHNIVSEAQGAQRVKLSQQEATRGPRPAQLTPNQALATTRSLRNDFNRETKAAQTVVGQLALMRSSIAAVKKGAAPAGSQGVLVTFQKILDPTSVVRESEYARSASGLSLLGRLEGKWMQISQGGAGVKVEDLEQFVSLAEDFARNQQKFANESKTQIDAIAKEYGLKPELITRDIGGDVVTPTQPSAAPAAAPAGGRFEVKAPNGKTYTFPTQAQADVFKKRAGIK